MTSPDTREAGGASTPADVICAALEPALRNGLAINRTAKVLDALRKAGWGFVHDTAVADRRPISTAPYNEEVYVYCGEMRFRARLALGASLYEAENGKLRSCDQWQATRNGEHPPCWSEGGCWASNADEEASIQPTHWSPIEPTTQPQERL